MKRIAAAIAAAILPLVGSFCLFVGSFCLSVSPAAADEGYGKQLNPCAVPNEIVNSPEETAWRIWVAATCPVNSSQYP